MSKSREGKERRRHPRIPVYVRVDYQLVDTAGVPLDEEVRTAFTQDLSDSGIKVELTHLPERLLARVVANDEKHGVNLDLHLPKSTLRLATEVVWVEKSGSDRCFVGLKYTYVTERSVADVVEFARTYTTRAPLVRKVAIAAVVVAVAAASALLYSIL